MLQLRVGAAEAEFLAAVGRDRDALRLLGELVERAPALGGADDADRFTRRLADLGPA